MKKMLALFAVLCSTTAAFAQYHADDAVVRWKTIVGNISPANSDAAAAPAAQVYFTAGPNHGSGGLFGYLAAVSSELTEENAQ